MVVCCAGWLTKLSTISVVEFVVQDSVGKRHDIMTSQRRRIALEGDTVKVRNTGKRERSELADLDRSARSVVAENTVPGAEVLHTSMDGDGRTSNAAPPDQENAADQQ